LIHAKLGELRGEFIPKSSLRNEDFALRSDEPIGYQTLTSLWDRHEVTKTLILKVFVRCRFADDEYQHGDLKRRSINPDIGYERFNSRGKCLNFSFQSSMRSIKNSLNFLGLYNCRPTDRIQQQFKEKKSRQ